jgi:hypothetical protein
MTGKMLLLAILIALAGLCQTLEVLRNTKLWVCMEQIFESSLRQMRIVLGIFPGNSSKSRLWR